MLDNIDNYEYLGVFENTSDKFLIGDPGHDVNTWCAGTVPAKLGLYHSFALYADTVDGDLVAALLVVHDDDIASLDLSKPVKQKMEIDSDANTVGIWDLNVQSQITEEDFEHVFFVTSGDYESRDIYCPLRPLAGVMSYGPVVGTGDGPSKCFTSRDPGAWVLVRFVDPKDINSVITYENYIENIMVIRRDQIKKDKELKKSMKRFKKILAQLKMET